MHTVSFCLEGLYYTTKKNHDRNDKERMLRYLVWGRKMEVTLVSIYSVIIIFITVTALIKVFNIAIKRKEISKQKYKFLVTSCIMIGLLIASILPFGYQKIFEFML